MPGESTPPWLCLLIRDNEDAGAAATPHIYSQETLGCLHPAPVKTTALRHNAFMAAAAACERM